MINKKLDFITFLVAKQIMNRYLKQGKCCTVKTVIKDICY